MSLELDPRTLINFDRDSSCWKDSKMYNFCALMQYLPIFCSVYGFSTLLILLIFYSYALHEWHIIKTVRLLHYLRILSIYIYFCIIVFTGMYLSVCLSVGGELSPTYCEYRKHGWLSIMCVCRYVHNRIRWQIVLSRRWWYVWEIYVW